MFKFVIIFLLTIKNREKMAVSEKTKGIITECVRFVLTVLGSIFGFNLLG